MNLDGDVLRHLSDAEKQYVAHVDEVFNSAGWNLIRQDLAEENEIIRQTIDNARTWDEYNYARGARDVYNYFMNTEGRTEDEFRRRAAERAEEDKHVPIQDFI